jgi:hypothetical protein
MLKILHATGFGTKVPPPSGLALFQVTQIIQINNGC